MLKMAEKTRDEILEHFKTCSPRDRNTLIQTVEGKVSEDDAATFVRETLCFMESDMTTRQLTFVSSRLCDCGKLVSQENPLRGRCQHPSCTRYICGSCVQICEHCKKAYCGRHSKQYKAGDTYCITCRRYKWGRTLLEISKRVVK